MCNAYQECQGFAHCHRRHKSRGFNPCWEDALEKYTTHSVFCSKIPKDRGVKCCSPAMLEESDATGSNLTCNNLVLFGNVSSLKIFFSPVWSEKRPDSTGLLQLFSSSLQKLHLYKCAVYCPSATIVGHHGVARTTMLRGATALHLSRAENNRRKKMVWGSSLGVSEIIIK